MPNLSVIFYRVLFTALTCTSVATSFPLRRQSGKNSDRNKLVVVFCGFFICINYNTGDFKNGEKWIEKLSWISALTPALPVENRQKNHMFLYFCHSISEGNTSRTPFYFFVGSCEYQNLTNQICLREVSENVKVGKILLYRQLCGRLRNSSKKCRYFKNASLISDPVVLEFPNCSRSLQKSI